MKKLFFELLKHLSNIFRPGFLRIGTVGFVALIIVILLFPLSKLMRTLQYAFWDIIKVQLSFSEWLTFLVVLAAMWWTICVASWLLGVLFSAIRQERTFEGGEKSSNGMWFGGIATVLLWVVAFIMFNFTTGTLSIFCSTEAAQNAWTKNWQSSTRLSVDDTLESEHAVKPTIWTTWSMRAIANNMKELIEGETYKVNGPHQQNNEYLQIQRSFRINIDGGEVSFPDEISVPHVVWTENDLKDEFDDLEDKVETCREHFREILKSHFNLLGEGLDGLEENYPLRGGFNWESGATQSADNGLDLPLRLLFLAELKNAAHVANLGSDYQSHLSSIDNYFLRLKPKLGEVWNSGKKYGYRKCYLRWYDPLISVEVSKHQKPELILKDLPVFSSEGDTSMFARFDSGVRAANLKNDDKDKPSIKDTSAEYYIDGSIAALPLYTTLIYYENEVDFTQVHNEPDTTPVGSYADSISQTIFKTFANNNEIDKEEFVVSTLYQPYRDWVTEIGSPSANGDRVGTRALYFTVRGVAKFERLLALNSNLEDNPNKKSLDNIYSLMTQVAQLCSASNTVVSLAIEQIQKSQGESLGFNTFYCYCYLIRASATNAGLAAKIGHPELASDALGNTLALSKLAQKIGTKSAGSYSHYFKPLGDLAAINRVFQDDLWKFDRADSGLLENLRKAHQRQKESSD